MLESTWKAPTIRCVKCSEVKLKLFEDTRPPQDAAALVLALFREFKEAPGGVASQRISPSGLACQVACAWKLTGIETEPQKESFQSRGFAEAGEDRHKRIQDFLSRTPYWVDVADYVKQMQLPMTVLAQDGYEVLLEHNELPIRFRCDGMLFIDGVYYILEIKTERSQANIFRVTYDPKHQKQGICYSTLMHTERILWVYEGRDMLEQKPFVQIVKKSEKEEMLKYLHQIVDNQHQPENLLRDEKSCGYCVYKKHCRTYYKELKKREKEATKNAQDDTGSSSQ